jgi:hypothetical protein
MRTLCRPLLFGVALALAFHITQAQNFTLQGGNFQLPPPSVSGPVYADQQAGADICAKIVTAMTKNPGGAEIIVPVGNWTTCAADIVVPNDGTVPPQQASFKLTGMSSDAGSVNEPTLGKNPATGTIINFGNTSPNTGHLDTRGAGTLEISGITFKAANDCGAIIFTSNTILKVHDNYFYGAVPAYITHGATHIQTTGGSSLRKYQIGLGNSTVGVVYRYFVEVKNQGAGTVTVYNNQSTLVSIPAGTTKQVSFDQAGNGSALVLGFETAKMGDAMDVLAFVPTVAARNYTNLITGASLTFAGSWSAQFGATPTLTQGQTVDQEPCNDGIVLGGSALNIDGTSTGAFQGYGTEIRANNFNNIQRAVRFRAFANAVVVENNTVWINSGSSSFGAIDFDASLGEQGNYIAHNTIEVFAYKYGIHLGAGVGSNYLSGNNCFDSAGAFPFVACTQLDNTASSNVVIDTNLIAPSVVETNGQNTIISHGNKMSFPTPAGMPAQFNRLRCNLGTPVGIGNFVLSGGWGSTATVSVALGTDCSGIILIASSGTGQAANPTITFNPQDANWPTSPVIILSRQDISVPQNVLFVPNSGGNSAETWTFTGTPVAGNTYGVYYWITGKP